MAGRIVVGTSSWADPGFVAEWYPPGLPARDRLPWYAERFEAVELNSSFYAVPDRGTVERWGEVTPPGFRPPPPPARRARAADRAAGPAAGGGRAAPPRVALPEAGRGDARGPARAGRRVRVRRCPARPAGHDHAPRRRRHPRRPRLSP